MPRRKKANPIRHTYSRDLKRRVTYQAFTLSFSSTAISISLDIPLRVVQRVRRNWSTIGEVCRDRTYMGRPPSMGRVAVKVCLPSLLPIGCLTSFQFMLALIEHSPDIYLDEIQDQLYEQHDIDISLPTIWETLK